MANIKLGYEDGMYLLRLVKQVESLRRELNISDTGMQNLAKAKRALVGALGTSDDDGAITGLPGDGPPARPVAIEDVPLQYVARADNRDSLSVILGDNPVEDDGWLRSDCNAGMEGQSNEP